MGKNGVLLATVALLFLATTAPPAIADLVIDIHEVGPDLVVTGAGTANLTALSFTFTGVLQGWVHAQLGAVLVGSNATVGTSLYLGVSGPLTFGTSGRFFADFGSGDSFGVQGSTQGSGGLLYVPSGYPSLGDLSGSMTLSNQTFASLGMTPGPYVWTWGSGETADSLTVNIGVAPIPEPTTLALFGLGLAGLVAWRRKRRKA